MAAIQLTMKGLQFSPMKKIVRLKDAPRGDHSIQTVKYAPLNWDPSSLDDNRQMTHEQAEQNVTSFATYSMLYALKLLDIAEIEGGAFRTGYEAGQGAAIKEMQDTVDSRLALHPGAVCWV